MAPPDVLLPRLGMSIGAATCIGIAVAAFLALWIFGGDAKVGRVFLVWMLGDGTRLTQSMLQADPKLPLYRIFNYDAYKAAFVISAATLPLSLFAMWLARRARQANLLDPARYGGRKMAQVSFALGAFLFVTFSVVDLSSLPGVIERGRARRLAATRAKMYELHAQALQKYYQEYGMYPQEMTDLSRINAEAAPQTDYWENAFEYAPIPADDIASRGLAISFSGYKLVSAGPDGIFGTPDDVTMVDGVIVESKPDPDLPKGMPAQEKPRRK
ncbi:MAG: hypothetical protein ACKVX9_11725 [Blastocatellia bacterium]